MMNKGGHNDEPSQVTERPAPPPASNPPKEEPPFTKDILHKVVNGARYKPGYRFRLVHKQGAWFVLITDTKCINAYTYEDTTGYTEPFPLTHERPVPMATYNEASWRRWLFEQCRAVENHEIGEWLRWGDERPFAPLHGPGEDPYTVHEFRPDVDRRTTQDGSIRKPNRSLGPPFRDCPMGGGCAWEACRDECQEQKVQSERS